MRIGPVPGDLNAPFTYFGGKSAVAAEVWERLGPVENYVEPFAGSLAVLLARPGEPGIETVNDLDGYIASFWRALKCDPDAVAAHATNPVNECDLHARHSYLVSAKGEFVARLCGDPEFYDAKLAGWWVWGKSCWIGGGFCSGDGPWQSVDGMLVHAGRPGSRRQLPHLGWPCGVTKKLPHLGTAGDPFGPSGAMIAWMRALAARLRTVRVCSGDWSRVLGPSVTTGLGTTGVVLDPPYGHGIRDTNLYANDAEDVTDAVGAWCMANGADPRLRIALCGYEGEYDLPGWEVMPWKAQGGYGNQGDGRGRSNRHLERVWFSPNCLRALDLFGDEL